MFHLPCHFLALEFPAAALDLAEVLVRLLLALLAFSAAAMGMRKLMLPFPCNVVACLSSQSSTCRGGGDGGRNGFAQRGFDNLL